MGVCTLFCITGGEGFCKVVQLASLSFFLRVNRVRLLPSTEDVGDSFLLDIGTLLEKVDIKGLEGVLSAFFAGAGWGPLGVSAAASASPGV